MEIDHSSATKFPQEKLIDYIKSLSGKKRILSIASVFYEIY